MNPTERPSRDAHVEAHVEAHVDAHVERVLAPLAALREGIAAARGVDQLAGAAAEVPRVAARLLAQTAPDRPQPADAASAAGPGAALDVGELTSMISALNDEISIRVVQAVAAEMRVDLDGACWLVFGSQARREQTLLTDQDNGLVFAATGEHEADARRPDWLAFGQRVNEALSRCGFALCEGDVMAGQPLCCLSADEWCRRFSHWMGHGDANALFAARIYFDLRPLAGNLALAQPLVDLLRSPEAAVPRFVKQMADTVLCNHVPLNWLGRVVTTRRDGRPMFDLKMSGTALFVDAGRLWALAHRLDEVGTVPRLRAAARTMRVPPAELAGWIDGFQALQKLRLVSQSPQLDRSTSHQRAWVPWDEFDAGARRALTQALRAARLVQQRIALDYCR